MLVGLENAAILAFTRNVMSKKTTLIVLLLLIILGALFWWYYRHRNVATRSTPHLTVSNRPTGSTVPTPSAPPAGSPESGVKAPATAPGFSPKPGELLEFAANISKLNSTVANLTVTVVEKKTFLGNPAWHLQAQAHTVNPYRMVFELDDRFESFSDPANLTSRQYELHLSERGQKIDSDLRILPSPSDPAPPDATAARVVPGTRDPLSMLYYLRSVDWSKTGEVQSPVFDGHKLYQVRAILQSKNESVSVPAGTYAATKIELKVTENGTEMKDAHFLLYLANDSDRTPVLMEAVLPIATARVELTKKN